MPSTQDTAPPPSLRVSGLAQAREITEEDYSVISVIGDGALTGGMAYEALNNAAQIRKNFIIVLNDNEMSISRNVGGMSKYLSSVRTKEGYAELKLRVERTLSADPCDRKTAGIRSVPVKERDQTVPCSGNAI